MIKKSKLRLIMINYLDNIMVQNNFTSTNLTLPLVGQVEIFFLSIYKLRNMPYNVKTRKFVKGKKSQASTKAPFTKEQVKAVAKIANKVDHANDETKRLFSAQSGVSTTTNVAYVSTR